MKFSKTGEDDYGNIDTKGHLSRWLGMEGLGPTSLFCVRGLP